jgi:hypothetical protein
MIIVIAMTGHHKPADSQMNAPIIYTRLLLLLLSSTFGLSGWCWAFPRC